jgi:hypothetical protein
MAHFFTGKQPAGIFHQLSTAAADPGMSTALRSVGFLDVLVNLFLREP